MMLAKTDFDFQTTAGFHVSHNFFPSCWLKEKKTCHVKLFLSLLVAQCNSFLYMPWSLFSLFTGKSYTIYECSPESYQIKRM